MVFRLAPVHLLVLGILLSQEVAATENADRDLFAMSLEELSQLRITVGSLLDSDELHAPANVSVVHEADWQRQAARRTLDAINHLPATMVLPYINGADVIAIRGYAQTTSARGIATTLDGIRLNNFAFGTGQYDTPNINLGILDRIEMVRGPASATYGSDAFHGVLSLYAFESETDLSQVTAEAASNGYYQASARHSSAVSDDLRLNLALAGSGQPDQDRTFDYTDAVSGDPATIDKDLNYRSGDISLKLVSDPNADLAWRWGFYADQYNSEDFPQYTARYVSGEDTTNYMTRLGVTRKVFADATVEASAYYRDSDVERLTKSPAGSVVPSGLNFLQEQSYGANVTFRKPRAEWETQWAIALGYDVEVVSKANLQLIDAAPGTPLIELLDGEQDREISSLALEANTQFADGRWSVVYGGRLDHYSDFGTQTSPRLGLIWVPGEDTAIKLLYGRAFRAPTAFELYIDPIMGVGSQGNPDLNPEIMDSVELVWMQQGEQWKSNVTLFENRWTDTIVLAFVSPALGVYDNGGKSRSRGMETSFSWVAGPWSLDANGSYVLSRDLETDQAFTLFPRLIINLGFGYQWIAWDTALSMVNRIFSRLDDVAAGGTASPHELPTYFRTDVVLSHDFDQHAQGFVTIINLFDRDNYLPSVLSVENGVPDEPLSLSVGMRYRF